VDPPIAGSTARRVGHDQSNLSANQIHRTALGRPDLWIDNRSDLYDVEKIRRSGLRRGNLHRRRGHAWMGESGQCQQRHRPRRKWRSPPKDIRETSTRFCEHHSSDPFTGPEAGAWIANTIHPIIVGGKGDRDRHSHDHDRDDPHAPWRRHWKPGAPAAISSIRVVAKETDDPDLVAATMSKPGVVLKRPAGSSGRFAEHSELPSGLDGEKALE
jgi:hypothetical protein